MMWKRREYMIHFNKLAIAIIFALLAVPLAARAQQEGPITTQTLVNIDSKSNTPPPQEDISLKVGGKPASLTGWSSAAGVNGSGAAVALLIDDGLRESVGRQIGDLQSFVRNLPPGMFIYIGYMRNGTVLTQQDFTLDHASAATKIRLPEGQPGISASPYFCLADFVQHWPSGPKARFVMMITNGVDPYNGSDSPLNQDSPNVKTAQDAAQRAGVAVYSIYYVDAGRGMRTEEASFSGQDYLVQVAQATGGVAYTEGNHSPMAMKPYLDRFLSAISETWVATFPAASSGNDSRLVPVKFSTSEKGTKLHTADSVLPGNQEGALPSK